jgi:hypothetical protein
MVAYGGAAGHIVPPHVAVPPATGMAEIASVRSGTDKRSEVGTDASALLERGRAALRAGDPTRHSPPLHSPGACSPTTPRFPRLSPTR